MARHDKRCVVVYVVNMFLSIHLKVGGSNGTKKEKKEEEGQGSAAGKGGHRVHALVRRSGSLRRHAHLGRARL